MSHLIYRTIFHMTEIKDTELLEELQKQETETRQVFEQTVGVCRTSPSALQALKGILISLRDLSDRQRPVGSDTQSSIPAQMAVIFEIISSLQRGDKQGENLPFFRKKLRDKLEEVLVLSRRE